MANAISSHRFPHLAEQCRDLMLLFGYCCGLCVDGGF